MINTVTDKTDLIPEKSCVKEPPYQCQEPNNQTLLFSLDFGLAILRIT